LSILLNVNITHTKYSVVYLCKRIIQKKGRKPIELVNMAEYLEIPKTVYARNLILMGLEDSRFFKKTGLLKLAKGLRKSSEFLQEINKNRQLNTSCI